ncbi:MAG: DUF4123 domain-containing protein [bacterium]
MPDPDHITKEVSQFWWSREGEIPGEMYTIIDSARDTLIYPKLLESDIEMICLYRGAPARELADVAPYLIKLKKKDSFTDWLLKNGWGKSWGIFLESPAPFQDLRRHFRRFLMVYDEGGTPLYFRYYDPRVFRVYLPTCNENELKTMFGPVSRYFVEGEDAGTMIGYSLAGGKLMERTMQLAE